MKGTRATKLAAVLSGMVVAALAGAPLAADGQEAGPERAPGADARPVSVVYLVRHAETADDEPGDPTLSDRGEARARRLARVLSDAGVEHVYSTPFRRTMGTARPVAEALGLEIRPYDPRDPASVDELLGRLRSRPGRYLVVGHSNTTPEMVRALGADPGSPIREDEHDRLYVVHLSGGTATATLLRFGEPSGAAGTAGDDVRRRPR